MNGYGKALLLILPFFFSACAPREEPPARYTSPPALQASAFLPGDGAALPVKTWLPQANPRAVIAYIHGFNDYSHGAKLPGEYFAQRGIALYAYDQRGFGANADAGIWPGEGNLVNDARRMVQALRARYPQTPVFLLGESMGGAVAITAMTGRGAPRASGLILVAPAVWGEERMNPLFRAPLWLLAHSFPGFRLSGKELHRVVTDNAEVARELARDPLFIKETRADAVLGLVRLMDDAHARMRNLRTPTLLLYGAHDEIIPEPPIDDAASAIPDVTCIHYPNGWHMLLRDLEREAVFRDIAAWIDKALDRKMDPH